MEQAGLLVGEGVEGYVLVGGNVALPGSLTGRVYHILLQCNSYELCEFFFDLYGN